MDKNRLPQQFLSNMQQLLGQDYDEFLKSYDCKPLSGLRVNTHKISVDDFLKIAPFNLEAIPYVDNGFFINDADAWSKHPYYYAGLYYLQEPSAMLPANRLPIDKGDIVLDLCAAPGGKSTALYAKGCKLLISNDISYSRTIPLVKNLEIAGAGEIFVINEDPKNIETRFEGYFDKILVDAPCSGEGMFRKNSSLITSWEENGPKDYCEVQKSILESACRMLKPGGMIMYSTCTFAGIEDEETIRYILDKYSDIHVENIADYEGFYHGYEEYVAVNKELIKCVHVLPHKMDGEGHFLTLLRKDTDTACHANGAGKITNKKLLSYDKLPKPLKDFFGNLSDEIVANIKKHRFLLDNNQMVYMLPLDADDVINSNIHFVRTGVVVGNIGKGDKFTPHTAFALWLNQGEFINVLDLKSCDTNVYKYLKGETLIIDDASMMQNISKGIVLVCVDGYALGFAKFDGSKFKNMYEKGWRLT